jgi:hypothetical protein
MIDHQWDMTPVVDHKRKKGTGAVRMRRPICVDPSTCFRRATTRARRARTSKRGWPYLVEQIILQHRRIKSR